MNEVYSPEEDSYLLSEVLSKELPRLIKKNENLRLLEIGVGSGIQLEKAGELGVKNENIFSVDINPVAVETCLNKGFNCIKSNLFDRVKEKYDLIIFNPPYLPEDKNEPLDSRIATTGGKKGSEIINKFLKQAKKYLKKEGQIFLLISSLTEGIDFKGYRKKILCKKKMFFEELEVWELRIKN